MYTPFSEKAVDKGLATCPPLTSFARKFSPSLPSLFISVSRTGVIFDIRGLR